VEQVIEQMKRRTALQQPEWEDPEQVRRVREMLASLPALVGLDDVLTLRTHLGRVAAGEALVVQSGDCAEDPARCSRVDVWSRCAFADRLAEELKTITRRPVVRVGRIAGQFAKPRSEPVERVGDQELPTYRGHMVNRPEPDPESRRPDPLRILTGYMAAQEMVEHIVRYRDSRGRSCSPLESSVWTSHEALLLDYEIPMLRDDGRGRRWLSTGHFPWVGERTRQVEGAHVALLAGVVNPIACKVGPRTTAAALLALCEQLDPGREPGRLTLISRLGADLVGDRLPPLVAAVRAAGHPVIWLTDPMHGNTATAPGGAKVRVVETIIREVRDFRRAVAEAGGVAGGLHLESTPDEVTECCTEAEYRRGLDRARVARSLCDPRLSPAQASSVVAAWRDPSSEASAQAI
jgi:3-deoxy-7-phosphoheptulonate synthase